MSPPILLFSEACQSATLDQWLNEEIVTNSCWEAWKVFSSLNSPFMRHWCDQYTSQIQFDQCSHQNLKVTPHLVSLLTLRALRTPCRRTASQRPLCTRSAAGTTHARFECLGRSPPSSCCQCPVLLCVLTDTDLSNVHPSRRLEPIVSDYACLLLVQ